LIEAAKHKPGDLPIERASKFALVVNLKTANAYQSGRPPSALNL
jgi:hypothetical protein